MKLAVTIDEAADLVPASESTIRRAIRKVTDDGTFPPPLPAKRNGKGHLSIKVSDLEAWHDSWEDA